MDPTMGPFPTAFAISSAKSSIPGLGSPIALTYPPVTSVKLGLAWPGLGSVPTDFETTAPAPSSSMRAIVGPVSSIMPDATMPGSSSSIPPAEVLRDAMLERMPDALKTISTTFCWE